MPTPHINAQPDDFADTVPMPGDPLCAQFIADTWLKDAKQVKNDGGQQKRWGSDLSLAHFERIKRAAFSTLSRLENR